MVDIALALPDDASAEDATRELEAIGGEYGSTALVAQAEQARGRVALAAGDTREAVARLQSATALWRQTDIPYAAAKARLFLADAHAANGSSDSARLERQAALAAFEALGAMADVRTARRALDDGSEGSNRSVRAAKTMMFTDIVNSTPLIGVIGDDAWRQLLAWHHRTLRSLFADWHGREVDNAGDGFFVAFEDAEAAVECAKEIQRTLARQRAEHGFAPEVRVGLHTGVVSEVGAGLAGEEVHKAARICGTADRGEILVSRELIESAGLHADQPSLRSLSLKGITEPVEAGSLAWR